MTSQELRNLLEKANLSQRYAAKLLDIHERTMRHYASGDRPIPRVVQLAITCLTCHRSE